ncbi:MAG: mucoidy inhibitor MuiA family protein [Leptospiraceae bacterium]|nr:mucoidy inhibitor MuiA family protein [Leptospiraceae bacterium]MCP5510957.1 mucoidy inhibitor MuiA family protein [Leptospiraceae bacterium]
MNQNSCLPNCFIAKLGFAFLIFLNSLSADVQGVEGKIKEVILYRNQAMIVREIKSNLKKGSNEVVVTNLPSGIIQNSLFAESKSGEVRATRIKTQELDEDPQSGIRELDEKLEQVGIEISRLNKLLVINGSKMSYLQKQEEFVTTTEKLELSRGVLNAGTLKEITLFNFEQKKELALEEHNLTQEIKKLQNEKNVLQRKRNQLIQTSKRSYDASIFLEKEEDGESVIRLYYLVNNAGWTPTYNFYAKSGEKTIRIEFNARIQQLSGENWENVALTLSNATPAVSAVSPVLSPFRITLSDGGVGLTNQDDFRVSSKQIAQKRSHAYKKQMGSKSREESDESNWEMNIAANDYQNLELIAKDEDLNLLKTEGQQENSSPGANFPLSGTVSLPSKNDQQLIKVEKLEVPAEFYLVSTPLLTNYVFREAEIQNNALENFLEGSVSCYLDNRFVGKGEIPNVSRGQTFLMGFGIDSKIRTKRVLYDKNEKFLGGNKEISFAVRILLENFSDKEITVRVLDRIPVEDEKEKFRLTLDLNGNQISKDELYNQYERPKGILRWDVNLLPETSSSKSKVLEYNYKLEFDKNLSITLPGANKTEQMKNEFKEIQKMRYKK